MRRYYQFLFSYVIKFLIFSIRPSFHPAILLSCSEIQGEWHIQESFLTGEDCELIFALPLSPRSERIFQSLAGLICRASSSISSNGPEFISYSFVRRKYILFHYPSNGSLSKRKNIYVLLNVKQSIFFDQKNL